MRRLGEELGDERQQQGRRVASPPSSRPPPAAAAQLRRATALLATASSCGVSAGFLRERGVWRCALDAEGRAAYIGAAAGQSGMAGGDKVTGTAV
jgi:hypothetical protein